MRRTPSLLARAALVLGLLLAVPHPVVQAQEKAKPAAASGKAAGKPQTKKTQALTKEVYAFFEAAQTLYDAKNYKGAMAKIDELKPQYEKLNDYEKATYWNFKASMSYALDDTKGAMEAYKNVLRQKELPEVMRNNTLYGMAQLSFATGEYTQAIKVMQKWMEVTGDAKPESQILLAQAYYQLKNYPKAEAATLDALKLAKTKAVPPKESWLSLLRAAFYEQKDYLKSAKVLEVMVQRWPKLNYWMQLAGLYGLAEKQDQQLSVLRANYEAGTITSEPDQLNLARLYLLNGAPFPAVQVLKRGFDKKTIQESAVTLQLYAQALSLSKEHKTEIITLEKLANLSGESKHFVYLGQAHLRLGQWSEAAAAYRKATQAKNVERPGSLQMQIGNALYNEKKYTEARAAFQNAIQYADTVKDGATWVNFMDKEIQRMKALEQPAS